MDIMTAEALCRLLRDAPALVLWGGGLFMAGLAPGALRACLQGFWEPLRTAAVVTLACALLALLPIEAAALGTGWRDAFDPVLLHGLLLETSIGTAWIVAALAAAGLIVTLRWPTGPQSWATVGFSALVLAASTLTGHAAMREGWAGWGQRGLGLVHLLAGGFWLGALLPLLPTLRALRVPSLHNAATVALRRFSGLGHGAVALVIASGTAQAALILGHWPDPAGSLYEALLFAKAGVVTVMTGLAIVNRYRFVPQIGQDPERAIHRIRRATLFEIGLGICAVTLVAVFGLLEPN